MKNKVYIICGPTASGKTAVAIELAKLLNSEIISADRYTRTYLLEPLGLAKKKCKVFFII